MKVTTMSGCGNSGCVGKKMGLDFIVTMSQCGHCGCVGKKTLLDFIDHVSMWS